MHSIDSRLTQVASDNGPEIGEASAERQLRVLFCSWSELDIASGTPVIVCDMLRHFSDGNAEVFTEENLDQKRRRKISIDHPVRKFQFHTRLWPFLRGHRIRRRLARAGFPLLLGQMVRHIRRFQPDCMVAIYAQPHWILATWMASRITRVPLVYHVHDAFLEANERRKNSSFASWLERKTLTSTRVLALDDNMADHYKRRYGIQCTVLRHIVEHRPLPAKPGPHAGTAATDAAALSAGSRTLTIGFAGAIYESNLRQLTELSQLVNQDPTFRLKVWSGSSFDTSRICGPRVEVAFEANYERLLANIGDCDLLYLPLHFSPGKSMAANAMSLSLPTKSFDYLLSGVPILVHCPEDFSLSRFFVKNRCGYVLNDPQIEAVREWLDAWRSGQLPPPDEEARLKTLQMHSAAENKRILWQVLSEEIGRSGTTKPVSHRDTMDELQLHRPPSKDSSPT